MDDQVTLKLHYIFRNLFSKVYNKSKLTRCFSIIHFLSHEKNSNMDFFQTSNYCSRTCYTWSKTTVQLTSLVLLLTENKLIRKSCTICIVWWWKELQVTKWSNCQPCMLSNCRRLKINVKLNHIKNLSSSCKLIFEIPSRPPAKTSCQWCQ